MAPPVVPNPDPAAASTMPFAVAVDIGGTFTDLVAYDYDNHQVVYTKAPTTYDNLVNGILDCFGKAGLQPEQANFVNHGTTLVINAWTAGQNLSLFLVSGRLVALAVVFSIGLGAVAGIIPAFRAARMDPVTALRAV